MSTAPQPCHFYNEDGYCRRGYKCNFLHICSDYITGDCQRGCPYELSHQLYDPQVRKVLDEAGIDPDQSKEALRVELTGEEPEICSFYLRGHCKFGYRCNNRHTLPYNWAHTKYKGTGYKTFTLNDWSDEYQEVKQHFFEAMKGEGADITSIQRMQNPRMWEEFEAKRWDMKNDYELQLYHGTRQANVHSICLNGFDPEKAGKNSAYLHHGHGVYFTSSAKYAAKGEFQDPDEKVVFLADVLVGKYTKGNSKYYSAPKGYDTCVDQRENPTKYVKFDQYSSYPSYVIYFR